MSDFGKLNFSTSFNPTSAFPLDARTYFTDLASAESAAATAEEVGSTNTVYYYGMRLVVADGETVTWYTIQSDKTLRPDGKGIVKTEVTQDDVKHVLNFYYTDGSTDSISVSDSNGVYLYDEGQAERSDRFDYPPYYYVGYPLGAVETGGRTLRVGDVLLGNFGNIYTVTHVLHRRLLFQRSEPLSNFKGSHGLSVYVIDSSVEPETANIDGIVSTWYTTHATMPYTIYRPIFVNDLLIDQNGYIYRVTETSGERLYRREQLGNIKGSDGKSAYQYAVEGGFEGTEAEFAEKLAAIGSGSSGDSGGGDDSGDENPDDDGFHIESGGNVSGSVVSRSVLYSPQTATDEEKAQARANIGAISENDISETLLQRLISQQLSKFVVIGPEEPDFGPCVWFDTNVPVPLYFGLDSYTDDTVISTEINGIQYTVLNTDAPILADDGNTVIINVSK